MIQYHQAVHMHATKQKQAGGCCCWFVQVAPIAEGSLYNQQ
jgi:hypothetical protein